MGNCLPQNQDENGCIHYGCCDTNRGVSQNLPYQFQINSFFFAGTAQLTPCRDPQAMFMADHPRMGGEPKSRRAQAGRRLCKWWPSPCIMIPARRGSGVLPLSSRLHCCHMVKHAVFVPKIIQLSFIFRIVSRGSSPLWRIRHAPRCAGICRWRNRDRTSTS